MKAAIEQTPECRPAGGRLSRVLSRMMLAGLALAIVLMIAGAVLAAVRGSSVQSSTSITDLPKLLANGDPSGLLDLGLLVLLATPFARVVALVIAFASRREWLFAGISLVVIAILALSAFLGLRLA
jgi:uncharacterized membrane protein